MGPIVASTARLVAAMALRDLSLALDFLLLFLQSGMASIVSYGVVTNRTDSSIAPIGTRRI
jgi:hypothetical protein